MNDLQKEKLTTWLLSDGSFQSGDHLEEITDAIRSAIEAHETLQYLEEAILSIPEEYRNQISDEYRVLRGEVSRCSVCDEIVEPHEGVTTTLHENCVSTDLLLKYPKLDVTLTAHSEYDSDTVAQFVRDYAHGTRRSVMTERYGVAAFKELETLTAVFIKGMIHGNGTCPPAE